MIPVGDNDQGLFTPVTTAIIVLNVIMWILELRSGESFLMKWVFIPSRFRADPVGQFKTVISSMFMHASVLHLAGNMIFLWVFGNNIEAAFGSVQFALFYLACGIIATFAQMLVGGGGNVPSLGASGAIAGVLGAYLILFPNHVIRLLIVTRVFPISAYILIGFWIGLQLLNEFLASQDNRQRGGGVAYMAHIGGFVAGLILTMVITGRGWNLPV
jgi:rhomboid family protein